MFGLFGTGEPNWARASHLGAVAAQIAAYLEPCVAGREAWQIDFGGATDEELARDIAGLASRADSVTFGGPLPKFVVAATIPTLVDISDRKVEMDAAVTAMSIVLDQLFDLPADSRIEMAVQAFSRMARCSSRPRRCTRSPGRVTGLAAIHAGEPAAAEFAALYRADPKRLHKPSDAVLAAAHRAFEAEDRLADAKPAVATAPA